MKRLTLVLVAVALIFSACTVNINAGPPTKASAETTEPTEEEYPHRNSAGPIDEDHYVIGLEALYAIDRYLCGKNAYDSVLSMQLKEYYSEISALPEDPDDSPYKAGNELVEAYVFLPYSYFGMDPEKLDDRLIEGRGYLADALGVTVDNLADMGG